METKNIAYSTKNRLERTRYFMGGYWTFLANGSDTNGQFSLIEINLKKGLEPPAHTHTYEDESFHVIEGEVKFTADNVEHHLKAGELIHLPKGVTHSFKLQTDTAKLLTQMVPAGLENFFIQLSVPADKLDFPPLPIGPPSPEIIEKIALLQKKYGIVGIDNTKIKSL